MDQTEDGRRLKWRPICDEFSRELVVLEVERRMEARDVIRILDEAVAARLARPPTSLVPSASSADVCRSSSAATTARNRAERDSQKALRLLPAGQHRRVLAIEVERVAVLAAGQPFQAPAPQRPEAAQIFRRAIEAREEARKRGLARQPPHFQHLRQHRIAAQMRHPRELVGPREDAGQESPAPSPPRGARWGS